MATRIPAPVEFLYVDELERKLTVLSEQVELLKEEVMSNFQQLHGLLAVRETFLLKEMDDIVTRVRQEIDEKKGTLQELNTAREGLERDLTKNKLKEVLEKNLRQLEDEIGKELARDVNVGWIELDWKREQLEQSVIEVCKVVPLNERPVIPAGMPLAIAPVDKPLTIALVDYSAKKFPVWSRDGTSSSEITNPMQLAIEDKTQKIFVADFSAKRIQVFNGEGYHLYQIPTSSFPTGLALTDEYIFVSTTSTLMKIKKSSNNCIKSVKSNNTIWGMDTNSRSEIYGCEVSNQSVIVFDKNLKSLRRIKLKTTQVRFDTLIRDIKLYEDKMYVMFDDGLFFSPPFHLQVFTQKGELVRCLIKKSEISRSYFFCIDQSENILAADWDDHQIKIFSKEGSVIHTITRGMLPRDQKIYSPKGIAIDKKNRIIVAQGNYLCNLLAL